MTVSSLFTKDQAGVCDSNKGPGSVGALVLLLMIKCASVPAEVCASAESAGESLLSTVESESLAGN